MHSHDPLPSLIPERLSGSLAALSESSRLQWSCSYQQIPPGYSVTLLAGRGFGYKQLIHWLEAHQRQWAIQLKGDVSVRLAMGRLCLVDDLWTP